MIKQFRVTLATTATSFPTTPQVQLPQGVSMDTWTFVSEATVPIEIAFNNIRKTVPGATATDIVDLEVSNTGPGAAFFFNQRANCAYLRCKTAPAAPVTIQINCSKEK